MQKFTINILPQSLAASVIICAFLFLAGLQSGNAQSEQNTNASPQNVKAYKTLNFGDDIATVKNKLADIVVGAEEEPSVNYGYDINNAETFWRSLFDNDTEYEPYKFNENYLASQSDKLQSLMHYFGQTDTGHGNWQGTIGVKVLSCKNNVISVNCFQLDDKNQGNGVLAIVEVSYLTFDVDKLIAGFIQNYPNAKKENETYRIADAEYPGVFLEYEKTLYSDIDSDRRATLSIDAGKTTYTFTEPSKLSKEQLAVWETAMTQDSQTDMNVFFESVKTSRSELAKNMKPDAPSAVFASKQILDHIMNNYFQSIKAEDQEEKAKLKKESDSANGF